MGHRLLIKKEVVQHFPATYTSTLKEQFNASGVLDSFKTLKVDNVAGWSHRSIPTKVPKRWRMDDSDPETSETINKKKKILAQ